MDELELLERLQTIQNKLKNNEELTDQEHKLLASVLFVTIMGVVKWSFGIVSKVMEGDKDE